MDGFSVLAMLAVTAAVVFCGMFLVVRLDVAARIDRHRSDRRVRLDAALLLAEIERFRKRTADR